MLLFPEGKAFQNIFCLFLCRLPALGSILGREQTILDGLFENSLHVRRKTRGTEGPRDQDGNRNPFPLLGICLAFDGRTVPPIAS